MLNFSLMGAGRIGKMHAKFIAAHPKAKLKYIYDVNSQFAEEVAKSTGCSIASSPEEAINSDDVDAVLIASATPTHTQFITMAAKAGKARFDASHAKAQQARTKKEIGELEMVVITSRDPEPPGIDYLKAAGGFFRDTTIHDFDLTRFILGDDPVVQISAFGDALFDKNAQQEKDLDTAMFILKSKKGVLIHINNSRRAVYGYDQRVEVFGSKGMVISNNQTPTSLERYTSTSTNEKEPIHFFFIERYEQAYRDQFNEFVKCVEDKTKPLVGFEDGRNALIIANAAYESFESGKVIDVKF